MNLGVVILALFALGGVATMYYRKTRPKSITLELDDDESHPDDPERRCSSTPLRPTTAAATAATTEPGGPMQSLLAEVGPHPHLTPIIRPSPSPRTTARLTTVSTKPE